MEIFEVSLEESDPRNRMQEWTVDDGGRIASMAYSELTLTTTTKTLEGCELKVEKKEEKDAKKKQDQCFNICVLLEDGEQVWEWLFCKIFLKQWQIFRFAVDSYSNYLHCYIRATFGVGSIFDNVLSVSDAIQAAQTDRGRY